MEARKKLWLQCSGCVVAPILVALVADNTVMTSKGAILVALAVSLITLVVASVAASTTGRAVVLKATAFTLTVIATAAIFTAFFVSSEVERNVVVALIIIPFSSFVISILCAMLNMNEVNEDSNMFSTRFNISFVRLFLCFWLQAATIGFALCNLTNFWFAVGIAGIGIAAIWASLFLSVRWEHSKAVKPSAEDKQHCLEDGDPGLGC